MGKSAQLFLHTWLPDAMEGPTPVSALIHAATMVTAGVFLIARCSPLFEYSEHILTSITLIGGMTSFFAGTVGLVQNDLKKVIAYSTCSQLGYMIFACGVSNYNVGVFHLFNHAFFKALLFLSAGSVIHALGDEQDMRRMGGLRRILPFTYIMFVIGSLSLMGFPFLTGFYSKDAILEVSYAHFSVESHFSFWLGSITAFCTAFYSTRLLYLTFLIKTNGFRHSIINAHDAPLPMAFPLAILAFGSIAIGFLTRDMFIGLGTDFWNNSIFILPSHINIIDAEFLPTLIKIGPVICSVCGMLLAFYLYRFKLKFFYRSKTSYLGVLLYNFLNRKWFFDKVYNEFISQSILHISYFKTYKLVDRGIIELFGPFGITNLITNLSRIFSKLHTGFIYNSAIVIIINAIILLFYISVTFSSTFN
jgi:NADH-ubiquinone oxidoreductase chain 5